MRFAFICAAVLLTRLPQGTDSANLIRVDVGVVRPNSESVTDLVRTDFEIFVDGTARPVEAFSADRLPVALALLIDVSRSMQLTHTEYRFGQSWLSPLRPEDRVIVGSIARPNRLAATFASDRREIQKQVDAAFKRPMEERSGPSPIWDAIDAAVIALQTQKLARQAVIVVTDGQSTGNAIGFTEIVTKATSAGISVSIVYTPTGVDRDPIRQSGGGEVRIMAEPGLLKFVDETGGLFRHAGDNIYADPQPHVEKILRWLHEGYTLGFSAPVRDGKWHKVEVKVKRSGLVVLARKAFLAPTSVPLPHP